MNLEVPVPLIAFVLIQTLSTKGEDNVFIDVPTTSSYLRSIDGAVLRSRHTSYLYKSTVKLRAKSFADKLKIKFLRWSVPSGVSVKISFPNSFKTPLTIRSTHPAGYTLESGSRYATFEFSFSSSSGYRSLDFYIVVTAVETSYMCDEFRCSNGDCIDDDLKCDHVDHCFDNSDERSYACSSPPPLSTSGHMSMSAGLVGGIVMGVIAVCIVLCVVVACCCRSSRGRRGVVMRTPAGGATVVTTTTTSPPPGSYPAQPGAYPAQPGYPNTYSPPSYPAPTTTGPTYPYGQGTGYTGNTGLTPDAPPAYESVVGNQDNKAYSANG